MHSAAIYVGDYRTLPNRRHSLMPLGAREYDWKPILTACQKADAKHIFAEQERWEKDAFKCAAESLACLQMLIERQND